MGATPSQQLRALIDRYQSEHDRYESLTQETAFGSDKYWFNELQRTSMTEVLRHLKSAQAAEIESFDRRVDYAELFDKTPVDE